MLTAKGFALSARLLHVAPAGKVQMAEFPSAECAESATETTDESVERITPTLGQKIFQLT
jgi:hypothetical protein